MDKFVNLHNHSQYSTLDGFGTLEEYVLRAYELRQPAIGLTDHGTVAGLHRFIELCHKFNKNGLTNRKGEKIVPDYELKPIPGIEIYVAPENPFGAKCHEPVFYSNNGGENDVAGKGSYLHLTLFAMNQTGLISLFKLLNEASKEANEFNHLGLKPDEGNFYMKPRIDMSMLEKWNSGLIATTGCPSGEIQTRLRLGQYDKAVSYAERMKSIFGDRYYVEVMNHGMSKDIETSTLPQLLRLSRELNIPLLATNDAHYSVAADAPHHEEMLCLNSGAYMTDLPYDEGGSRFAFNGDQYYLKSRAEMERFLGDTPEMREALDNTLKLADRIEPIDFTLRKDLRPVRPIPEGKTDEDVFKEQIFKGFQAKRQNNAQLAAESKTRILRELPVFVKNNFVQYMLVVQDYINHARSKGIPVGFGRGCFLPNNMVTTSNGRISISRVEPKTMVLTHDGTYQPVEKRLEYSVNKEDCVRVYLSDNTVISCTADHRIYTFDKGFVKAENLTVDEVLLGSYGENDGSVSKPETHFVDFLTHNKPLGSFKSYTTGKTMPYYSMAQRKMLNLFDTNSEMGGFIVDNAAFYNNLNSSKIVPESIIMAENEQNSGFSAQSSQNAAQTVAQNTGFTATNTATNTVTNTTNTVNASNTAQTEGSGLKTYGKAPFTAYNSGNKYVDSQKRIEDFINNYSPVLSYYGDDSKYVTISLVNTENTVANLEDMSKYVDTVISGFPQKYVTINVYDAKDLFTKDFMLHKALKVVKVEHFSYTGKVYDLQVSNVHNYTVDGITVHNSVGGSEIAYLMGISDTDPIRHNLMFERFLNPERLSPPDVDTDFGALRRDEVVDYVKNEYGEQNVANIITFTKFLSKTAVADMARIYQIPVKISVKAVSLMPQISNTEAYPLGDILGCRHTDGSDYDKTVYNSPQSVKFRQYTLENSNPELKEMWQKALKAAVAIENRIKTTGIHPCGIIIADKPITDVAPMMYKHAPTKEWGASVCQWEYEELESIGLIKMDFLALSDLDIVKDTLRNIAHTTGKTPDMYSIVHGTLDDKQTYKTLSEGKTLAVFQLSSKGMQTLFSRMQPSCFEDIQASVALYRPGPMGMDAHTQYADRSSHKTPYSVINPTLDKTFKNTPVDRLLKNTQGLVLYQEEVMNIARELCGFTWGEADALRKGMGHKKMDVLEAMKPKFIKGALEWLKNHGKTGATVESDVQELWAYLAKFGEYGFNASHAASYALVAYETAYLKTHYPAEFMAAVLANKILMSKNDEINPVIREIFNMGIKIGTLNINESDVTVTAVKKQSPDEPDIVFGFSGVKGISPKTAEILAHTRAQHGKYADFHDFMSSIPKTILNKTVVENLTKAGAFDCLGVKRSAILQEMPKLLKYYRQNNDRNEAKASATSLFDLFLAENKDMPQYDAYQLPDMPELSWQARLDAEYESLGMIISAQLMEHCSEGSKFVADSTIIHENDSNGSEIITVNACKSIKFAPEVRNQNGYVPRQEKHVRLIASINELDVKKGKKGSASKVVGILADMTDSMPFILNKDMVSQQIDVKKPLLSVNRVYLLDCTLAKPWYKDEIELTVDNAMELPLDYNGYMPILVSTPQCAPMRNIISQCRESVIKMRERAKDYSIDKIVSQLNAFKEADNKTLERLKTLQLPAGDTPIYAIIPDYDSIISSIEGKQNNNIKQKSLKIGDFPISPYIQVVSLGSVSYKMDDNTHTNPTLMALIDAIGGANLGGYDLL